ncbi:DUF6931 family protein [Roseomonas sp. BN140053]|uniref:DUF6931 family protein n=1 Tax=Roseomonas sp. BN140053 TaxID=3391898 RepID=UPI0039EC580B
MSTAPTPKLAVALPPLLPRLELDSAAATLLDGAPHAAEAVDRLEQSGRLQEASRLVAHALPKREAVWWACMCARAIPFPEATPDDLAALEAAEAWVRQPEEAQRRAAMAAAEKSGFRSAEAWAAVGAFWSGGSMAPPESPAVPPAEHLTGVAIAGAVTLAAVRNPPQRAQERFARFLAAARDIANGGAGRLPPETP